MFSLNRIVVLATPVFSAVAAVGTAWLARHVPGLPAIPPSDLIALEITGATAAGAAALKWLHGSQAAEKYAHEAQEAIADAARYAQVAGIKVPTESELVKAAEAKAEELAAQAAKAIDAQKAAEHAAGVAQTQLAHVSAAIARIRTDPNLVLPDVSEATPLSASQPEDLVAADVSNQAPASIAQPVVAADVGALTPISQTT
jgi:hypothetical protein